MYLILENISRINWYDFTAQWIWIIAVAILLYGLSQRDDIRSIKIVSLSMVFWSINYAMLWLISALLVTFIGFIRMYFSLKFKWNMYAFAFLLFLTSIAWYFSFDGTWSAMLPIASSVLWIIGFQLFSWIAMRLILLSWSFLWLLYTIHVQNIPWIINEVFVQLIMISTILRMYLWEEDKVSLKQKVRVLISKQTWKMRSRIDFGSFIIFRDRKRYLNDDFNHVYEWDEEQLKMNT